MGIKPITSAIVLALDMVPTFATRVQHLPYLLSYQANHSQNCNTVYPAYYGKHGLPLTTFSLGHGSDFCHKSASSVGPTSHISSRCFIKNDLWIFKGTIWGQFPLEQYPDLT